MKKKKGKCVHTSQALKHHSFPMTIQKQNQIKHNRISKNITAFKCVGLHQLNMVTAATKRDTNIVP